MEKIGALLSEGVETEGRVHGWPFYKVANSTPPSKTLQLLLEVPSPPPPSPSAQTQSCPHLQNPLPLLITPRFRPLTQCLPTCPASPPTWNGDSLPEAPPHPAIVARAMGCPFSCLPQERMAPIHRIKDLWLQSLAFTVSPTLLGKECICYFKQIKIDTAEASRKSQKVAEADIQANTLPSSQKVLRGCPETCPALGPGA